MILQIYTIKDVLTGFKGNLFTATCEQEALRVLKTAVNQEGTYVATYAKDIELWRIATFDTQSGKVEQADAGATFCTRAINLLEKETNNE